MTGTILDGVGLESGFVLTQAPDHQLHPTLAWTGAEFLVAWEDKREAAAFFDERTDVYGARVSAAGVVLDPGGVPLLSAEMPAAGPVLETAGGKALLCVSRFRADAPYAAYRAHATLAGDWKTLGQALPGAAGAPVLAASGALTGASTVELHLANAPAAAPGGHAIGSSKLELAFYGGVLVPSPDVVFLFTTDASGMDVRSAVLPGLVPPGLVLYVQSWMIDPAAPLGLAASNALVAFAP